MTRDEKIAEATRLHALGHKSPAIARRLGVTGSCVRKWLNPESTRAWARTQNARPEVKAAKLAWADAHDRALCPCGQLRGVGHHRAAPDGLCADCHADVTAIGVAMRRERIADMWAQGLTLRQIATAIGSTPGSVTTEMARARRDGWDLPYRHSWTAEGLAKAQNARRSA